MEEAGLEAGLEAVPILLADGESTITVKLKQTDGPRLDVDVALGCIHVLLTPSHVHMMTEMFKNLAATGKRGERCGVGGGVPNYTL